MDNRLIFLFKLLALYIFVPTIIYGVFIYARTARMPKWLNWLLPYQYDRRNPYRRCCRYCGTRESYFAMSYREGDVPLGWEAVGMIYPCKKTHI